MTRILIVDGNRAEINRETEKLGGVATGEGYKRVLVGHCPDIEPVIVSPCEDGPDCLPNGMGLEDFDGIVWTGSALNVYIGGPEIDAQIELARRSSESGAAIFGSCWGLQVMSVALGGTVEENPLGREIGIARSILVNEAGASHPMLKGRGKVFDCLAVHRDIVTVLPPGATILASNSFADVQALTLKLPSGADFWGVQYHPEFGLGDLAIIFRRYGEGLVNAGIFPDIDALERTADEYLTLQDQPQRLDLAWRYGFSCDTLNRSRRRTEVHNWLDSL